MVSRSFPGLLLSSALLFLLGCVSLGGVQSFSLQPRRLLQRSGKQIMGRRFMDPSFVEQETAVPQKQFDKNGQEFVEGQVVRVCKEGLKAYQVPPKSKGTFDATTFVPDDSLPYFVIPVGLRGVVTRVYDTEAISANFPIRVKFEPDELTDEGYNPPVSFLMHFLPAEIEIVS